MAKHSSKQKSNYIPTHRLALSAPARFERAADVIAKSSPLHWVAKRKAGSHKGKLSLALVVSTI
jgi:hypothetical protein